MLYNKIVSERERWTKRRDNKRDKDEAGKRNWKGEKREARAQGEEKEKGDIWLAQGTFILRGTVFHPSGR